MNLKGGNLNERLRHNKRWGDKQDARKCRKQCQSCSRTACLETVTEKLTAVKTSTNCFFYLLTHYFKTK